MEELKQQLKDWLKANQFMYRKGPQEKYSGWYKIWWSQGPTQTIIINGEQKTTQAPGSQHAVVFSWEDEPGWVSNEDGSNQTEFLQCKFMFQTAVGGDTSNVQRQTLDMNIYCLEDAVKLLGQFS